LIAMVDERSEEAVESGPQRLNQSFAADSKLTTNA